MDAEAGVRGIATESVILTPVRYDHAGAMVQKGELCYDYHPNGRLRRVGLIQQSDTPLVERRCDWREVAVLLEFDYDPWGRRIRKNTYGVDTWFAWDGQGWVIAEALPDGSWLREYFYLDGRPLAMWEEGDQRGAPVFMTDRDARVVWTAVYRPYGEAYVDNDPDGDSTLVTNNLRYPGQYEDTIEDFPDGERLYYNVMRYYDPGLGRYMTQEPTGTKILTGKSFYYAEGNPMAFIDTHGLDVEVLIVSGKAGLDPTEWFGHAAAFSTSDVAGWMVPSVDVGGGSGIDPLIDLNGWIAHYNAENRDVTRFTLFNLDPKAEERIAKCFDDYHNATFSFSVTCAHYVSNCIRKGAGIYFWPEYLNISDIINFMFLPFTGHMDIPFFYYMPFTRWPSSIYEYLSDTPYPYIHINYYPAGG